MKVQFKYSFLAGLRARAVIFGVIFIVEAVFIIFGSLGLLPEPALITAVSLGGVAIAAMLVANVYGNIATAGRMFYAPGAYLHALTPAPRWKTMLSSLAAMLTMDLVTMTTVIFGEIWMSLILANEWRGIWDGLREFGPALRDNFWYILLLIAGYLLFMLIVMFGVAAKNSFLYKKPASGPLTGLLVLAVCYIVSVLPLILTPFATVTRYGLALTLTLNRTGFALYILLTLLEAAAMFVMTAKLMERKMNL